MAQEHLKFLKLGNGNLTDINKAKFLLSKSFTAKDLLKTFRMNYEVLSFVLSQIYLEEKQNLN